MDAPDVSPATLDLSLRVIRRINRRLGYTAATVSHVKAWSKTWKPGERIEILDLATGSADIPRAILAELLPRGFDVHITGVDRHPVTAAIAADGMPDDPPSESRLRIVQADVLAMPFADRSFDYVMTNMFLHHLDDDDAVAVLTTMRRLARRGMLVADLLRHRRAWLWIKLLTLAAHPIIRHDAVVSVEQAFTRRELLSMATAAGWENIRFRRHFGHRGVVECEL